MPTKYEYLSGEVISTNQFSVTESFTPLNGEDLGAGTPGTYHSNVSHFLGVFIMYELSPISAEFKETSRSFLHFIINLMAILGGVFTVASLADSLLYGSLKRMEKKVELGKFV